MALTMWPEIKTFIWDIFVDVHPKEKGDTKLKTRMTDSWAAQKGVDLQEWESIQANGSTSDLPDLDVISPGTGNTINAVLIVMCALGVVGIILTFFYRHKKIIKMSSYTLSSFSAIGVILAQVMLMLFGLGPATVCTAPPEDVHDILWYTRVEGQACKSIGSTSLTSCKESFVDAECLRHRDKKTGTELCSWNPGTQPCVLKMTTICHIRNIMFHVSLAWIFMPLFFKVYKVSKIFNLAIPGEVLRKRPKKNLKKAMIKSKQEEFITAAQAKAELEGLIDEDADWKEKNPNWKLSFRKRDVGPPFLRSEIMQMKLDRENGVQVKKAEMDEAAGLVMRAVKVEQITGRLHLEVKAGVIIAVTAALSAFSFWIHPLRYDFKELDIASAYRFWGSCELCKSRFGWDPAVNTGNMAKIYAFQHLIPLVWLIPFFIFYGITQLMYVRRHIRSKAVGDTGSLMISIMTSPLIVVAVVLRWVPSFGVALAEVFMSEEKAANMSTTAEASEAAESNNSRSEAIYWVMVGLFASWDCIFFWNLFYKKLWAIWRGTDDQFAYIKFNTQAQSWKDWIMNWCRKQETEDEDCVGINMGDFKTMSMQYAKTSDKTTLINGAKRDDLDIKEYTLDGKNMLMSMHNTVST